MFLIRKFEEKAGQLYGSGKIGGFYHLYIGQEAVVIGILSSIKSEDTVVTSYRDHGHILARGVDPKLVMAELTGRKDGISKGKGGSMHMFSKKKIDFMVAMVLLVLRFRLVWVLVLHISTEMKKKSAEFTLVMVQ